jgi:hypothetical protein
MHDSTSENVCSSVVARCNRTARLTASDARILSELWQRSQINPAAAPTLSPAGIPHFSVGFFFCYVPSMRSRQTWAINKSTTASKLAPNMK